jgi:hypothetical protein
MKFKLKGLTLGRFYIFTAEIQVMEKLIPESGKIFGNKHLI